MSKFMQIAGILFIAVGIALGLMVFFSPGQMQIVALTPDVAAILLVGGVICLGLGGVIAGLAEQMAAAEAETAPEVPASSLAATEDTVIPPYGRIFRNARPADRTGDELSPSVRDTINALESARTDINRALGDEQKAPEPLPPLAVAPRPELEPEPEAEAEPIDEAVEDLEAGETPPIEGEDQLYVVEEKMIRSRPARVLSDGTVEAETDEGWMRFENLEHLDEYLDAMAPAAKT